VLIIGVDYHPSFQQISFLDQETGECGDRRLNHGEGEAERFYKELKQRGVSVRVGLEATGYSRWFERLLTKLGFEVWIGDVEDVPKYLLGFILLPGYSRAPIGTSGTESRGEISS
jgi:transposase